VRFGAERFSTSPTEIWTTAFQDLGQRIADSFVRQASHQRALAYLQGLMSPVARKNGWQVAEEVGEVTLYAMQHLYRRRLQILTGCWSSTRPDFSKRGANQWACNGSTAVQWHSRSHRKLPGGSISFLRQFAWAHLARSSIVFAQELDRRPGARPRSSCTSRGDVRHQTGVGAAYAGTDLRFRSPCRLGNWGYRVRERTDAPGRSGDS
jgi:hypothetical protein